MMTAENAILISSMMQAGFYNHPVSQIELIETHISLVFLTGDYAYKIKKPVNFGFLDFTQLEQRKFYCEEELRLNRRLAPDIYLDVLPITKNHNDLQLNGHGTIIEYAIRMRQFDAHGLFSQLIDTNSISLQHINTLAEQLAEFHNTIEISQDNSRFGNADEVIKPINQNFTILRPLLNAASQQTALDAIERYSNHLYQFISSTLQLRKQSGRIRECHGDLHLGNIALSNNRIIIFDGIEFNESFRWIDTMSDIAFLVMDLQDHQRNDYATHLLNRYLELSGDYDGLAVLGFYQLYRAMVRAKVAALRMQQESPDTTDYAEHAKQLQNYLNLALHYTQPQPTFLAITYGVSGSGKSWIAQQIADLTSAIVIRSDKERKRLYSYTTENLYTTQVTNKVYQYLLSLADKTICYGYPVILDATFLDHRWRMEFHKLAQRLNSPFHILHCHADKSVLEQRLLQRQTDTTNISDADILVMQRQLTSAQPIDDAERKYCIDINTGDEIDLFAITNKLGKHI